MRAIHSKIHSDTLDIEKQNIDTNKLLTQDESVRQIALKNAVDFCGDFNSDENYVIVVAKRFERYLKQGE